MKNGDLGERKKGENKKNGLKDLKIASFKVITSTIII